VPVKALRSVASKQWTAALSRCATAVFSHTASARHGAAHMRAKYPVTANIKGCELPQQSGRLMSSAQRHAKDTSHGACCRHTIRYSDSHTASVQAAQLVPEVATAEADAPLPPDAAAAAAAAPPSW